MSDRYVHMTLEVMRNDRNNLSKAIHDLERKQWMEDKYPKLKKLEGTYWKYLNSYSCPKGPEDHWWLYMHILKVEKDDQGMIVNRLEIDKDGLLEIRLSVWEPCPPHEGWVKSTKAQWSTALKRANKKLQALEPP